MKSSQDVYVGKYGVYPIPDSVLERAKKLSGDKWRTDRRTKGSRYVEWWGRCQDLTAETAAGIEKHIKLGLLPK